MTHKMTIDEAIHEMVARIKVNFQPEQIILFGSQARGDTHQDSDIDLLVVLTLCENRRITTVSIMKLLADIPYSKDIVVTTPQEIATRGQLVSTILYTAVHEGVVLYDSNVGEL